MKENTSSLGYESLILMRHNQLEQAMNTLHFLKKTIAVFVALIGVGAAGISCFNALSLNFIVGDITSFVSVMTVLGAAFFGAYCKKYH